MTVSKRKTLTISVMLSFMIAVDTFQIEIVYNWGFRFPVCLVRNSDLPESFMFVTEFVALFSDSRKTL